MFTCYCKNMHKALGIPSVTTGITAEGEYCQLRRDHSTSSLSRSIIAEQMVVYRLVILPSNLTFSFSLGSGSLKEQRRSDYHVASKKRRPE